MSHDTPAQIVEMGVELKSRADQEKLAVAAQGGLDVPVDKGGAPRLANETMDFQAFAQRQQSRISAALARAGLETI